MYKKSNKSPTGTHLIGEFFCSYKDLEKVLGKPSIFLNSITFDKDAKVTTEWILEKKKTGEVITIYDYKETSLYDAEYPTPEEFRKKKVSEWHVGGRHPMEFTIFKYWLLDKLNGDL